MSDRGPKSNVPYENNFAPNCGSEVDRIRPTPERLAHAVLCLARLAEQLRTQDNAITSDPIFVVQRLHREVGWDPDYTEHICWIDGANEDYVYPDVDPERHKRLEAAYLGEIDWPEDEAQPEDEWTRTGFMWKWEFVQPFMTREAAEAFRAAQAHNIGESRVYVESGYRNPEWRLLRAIVAAFSEPPEDASEQSSPA